MRQGITSGRDERPPAGLSPRGREEWRRWRDREAPLAGASDPWNRGDTARARRLLAAVGELTAQLGQMPEDRFKVLTAVLLAEAEPLAMAVLELRAIAQGRVT